MFPNLRWLNLTGTTDCCFKGIKKLALKLNDINLTSKIVFCEKYYISHAKNKMTFYNNLANEGYLKENWDQILYTYYKEIELL